MLTFVKTSAQNGAIEYTARADNEEIGSCRLTLEGTAVRLTYTARAYAPFVIASAVNAAASFGLRVTAVPDERLTAYGFRQVEGDMIVDPQDVVFPHDCAKA